MAGNNIDFSQPYEVYERKFYEKNKQYPQMRPMTREQYEAAAKQAGVSTPAASPGVDDTKAIGATKEDLDYMLQDGQISRAAYDKQIADLNTPEVQEAMAAGEKKADETVWDPSNRDETGNTNTALTDSVSEAVTPKEDDPPEVVQNKNRYNKAMMSIWDAYRNHEISKETAGYFTIDAIATLAKNLGRSIGNVGAQFSGGTIDNGHDTSMWEQRRDSMFGTELQKETEGIDTFENKFKQLSYNRNSTINDLIAAVKSDADKLSDDNPLKIAYLSLAAMIASGQVDGTTTLAATGAKGITELFNLFKGKGKK